MKTLLICNSISPVLIGEVTMCWIVHEGGNVVSLSGLVILFFCYCCLVLSTTVNVNCRACCVQIRADLGHITLVIPRDWISLQLSSGEQAMMPMPDLVDQQYQRAYLSATRFVYLLTQWKASYATKISKLVCLASSSMPTPENHQLISPKTCKVVPVQNKTCMVWDLS